MLSGDQVSLPLIAMQFTLRYLVKCTDYCMICHERVTGNFEALKPYVCDKPLCLFQYMNLGLGPSIDHEILNQEYVVDLLISFCFASLHYDVSRSKPSIRELPIGLSLQVPRIQPPQREGFLASSHDLVLDNPLKVEISWKDATARIVDELLIDQRGLDRNQWVVIHTLHYSHPSIPALHVLHHAQIEQRWESTLKLHVVARQPHPLSVTACERIQPWDWDKMGLVMGELVLCDQSLDDLQKLEEKVFSLKLLLSTLPSVREMRTYLMQNRHHQLTQWRRIPPSAMKLLRWIIASNRSYIIQLDGGTDKGASPDITNSGNTDRSQEKISGVDGWIQFRFAQGSPEKEALFFKALEQVPHSPRTILAWQ